VSVSLLVRLWCVCLYRVRIYARACLHILMITVHGMCICECVSVRVHHIILFVGCPNIYTHNAQPWLDIYISRAHLYRIQICITYQYLCVYKYVYVIYIWYIHVYIYIYIYVYVLRTHLYVYVYVLHTNMCICIRINIHTYIFICICTYMYVYICIYIYMHMFIYYSTARRGAYSISSTREVVINNHFLHFVRSEASYALFYICIYVV